ncbi:Chloroperoxidase [Elsinoe ampelina]|uniref:Chloroperoxidase n=1 Tax=Elsinoe ampelina TaxID=302913 RepID=A0A6A6G623_9PEZI|nr:Chloroperoxidase [Elsinoe ampelina]
MLNTLANHNFLPRDGRNITRENAYFALSTALNFENQLTDIMFDQAIGVNPTPNATFFTLEQLQPHNLLEHDASLSRRDAYFGNNFKFDAGIYRQTKRYFTKPVLDRFHLANARMSRMLDSKAFNPTYTFTNVTEGFSVGELLAPVVAFGDKRAVTTPRNLVNYFFENEKLPLELGWRRVNESVGLPDILGLITALTEAANLIQESPAAPPAIKAMPKFVKRNPHFGIMV